MTHEKLAIDWIEPLAEPYLRGFPSRSERSGELRGYWFARGKRELDQTSKGAKTNRRALARAESVGFFAGYLLGVRRFAFLNPRPPECLLFVFVHPVGGRLHKRLVRDADSLVRHTFEYIRWLTHRPPRFEFCECEPAAMVRHSSMREWPAGRYQLFSRNFFIETLAWLVRSGLVRKFLSEPAVTRAAK